MRTQGADGAQRAADGDRASHVVMSPPAGPADEELRRTRGQVLGRAVLPRGREVVLKLPLVPLGAAVALVAGADLPTARLLGQLVVLWFLVELLAYQARYQLNDLRDRAADARHPEKAHRGRLTFPWTPARAAAIWGGLVARVVLAVALAVWLPGSVGEAAVAFLVLLVVVSGSYELCRERIRRGPDVEPGSPEARRLGLPVLLCIPLGYGLRVGTGYHAAAEGGLPPMLAVLLVVAVLAVYTASVCTAWVLEATTFLGERGAAPAAGLRRRAHVGLLLSHAGLLRVEGRARGDVEPAAVVVARDRPASSWSDWKVWDVAGAVALLAAYAAAGVGGGAGPLTWVVLVTAALVSAAAPSVLHTRSRAGAGVWDGRAPWLAPGSLAVVVAVEVVTLLVATALVLAVAPGEARLLWLVAFVLFQVGSTRTSSYRRGFGPLSTVKRPLAWLRARS